MTLDEAIKREVQASLDFYDLADSHHTDENVYIAQETMNRDIAEYHEQLAEWLRELQNYQTAREEINQEIINWNDIDNGKVRGLFLAESIIAHYVKEVSADG